MHLGGYFLPHFEDVFNYHLLKYFLMAFLFVLFFWDSYGLSVWAFDIVPEFSEVVVISFNCFFFFSSLLRLFPPFHLLPHLSYLLPPLFYCWFLPECFDIIYGTSWDIDGETVETVSDFIFLGSKITADGDCSHEIKRRLLLGRKLMTNLDSIFKSRDITLPTKVRLVKAMVFPVVMCRCESWTVKKPER